jgi:hypothetical protein
LLQAIAPGACYFRASLLFVISAAALPPLARSLLALHFTRLHSFAKFSFPLSSRPSPSAAVAACLLLLFLLKCTIVCRHVEAWQIAGASVRAKEIGMNYGAQQGNEAKLKRKFSWWVIAM